MPWKSISLVEARCRFVKLLLKTHQPFGQLCRLFHISRKTGYKWKARFWDSGHRGLRNRSRRPKHPPNQIPACWMQRIGQMRRRHRRWGARKIRARLSRQYPRQRVPAVRTITRCIQRLGLPRARYRSRRRGPVVMRSELTVAQASNQVWTVDFKGWFRTSDGRRVEPLTVRDLFSRYLLVIRLLPDQQWWRVRVVFMDLFRQYGRPKIIRVDNGGPFGSKGPAGLSRLSAWWTALGIEVQFIAPGHPEQNGGHEQMHRVMKAETTTPVSSTLRAQQRRTNRWVWTYNQIRPHEGLQQRTPAQCYRRPRNTDCPKVQPWVYPKNWDVRSVRSNGQIRWRGRLRFLGEAYAGFKVGLKLMPNGHQAVYFRCVRLGELRTSDAGGLRPSAYVRRHPLKLKKV